MENDPFHKSKMTFQCNIVRKKRVYSCRATGRQESLSAEREVDVRCIFADLHCSFH